MNIPTLVILVILTLGVIFIVRGMIRDKRAGKSCHGCSGSCGGSCGGCSSTPLEKMSEK